MTTPSTSVAGVPDTWHLLWASPLQIFPFGAYPPPQEVPPSPGQLAPPLYQPPIGKASLLRAIMDQQAQMLQTPGLQTPAPQAPMLRATAPWAPMPLAPESEAPLLLAPQMAPHLCQPLPSSGSQPATPYQQAVQPAAKPKGRGVTFDTSANKVAAIGGQDTDGHGRQRTRDRQDKAWPTSPGRSVCQGSSVRTTSKQTPHQVSKHPSGATRDAPRDSTPGSTLH